MEHSNYVELSPKLRINYFKRLGSGTFGDVYEGLLDPGNKVAIKVIKMKANSNVEQQFYNEINFMKNMDHPNILKIFGEVNNEKGLFIVLEYCEGGSLENYIQTQKKIHQYKIFEITKQISKAMTYVHNDMKGQHRDIKPANILFNQNKTTIKIADFGTGKQMQQAIHMEMNQTKGLGTPFYMAPNVSIGKYSNKCDVFSLGAMVYHMLTGDHVYQSAFKENDRGYLQTDYKNLEKNSYQKLDTKYHQWFQELIKNTVTFKQEDRFSFAQVLEFVQKNEAKVKGELLYPDHKHRKTQNKGDQRDIEDQPQSRNKNKKNRIRIISQINHPKGIYQPKLNDNYAQTIKEQNNKSSLLMLKRYIRYLYDRCLAFVNFGKTFTRLKELNKYQKYIVFLLCINIFEKGIDELLCIFNKKQIELPDKRIFSKTQMIQLNDEETMKSYNTTEKKWTDNLNKYKNSFSQTKNDIINFLREDSNYPDLFEGFTDEIRALTGDISQNNTNYTKQAYEYLFDKFLMKVTDYPTLFNQIPIKLQNREEYIRSYWTMLKLVRVNETFPIRQYDDNLIMQKFKKVHQYISIEEIEKEIKILEIKIQEQ